MLRAANAKTSVLFVLPNFAGGGAERVALTLLAGLDQEQFNAQLAVLDSQGPLRSLLAGNTTLFEVNQPRLRRALPGLLKLIRQQRPAIVFATQGYLNIALLAARSFMPSGTRLALRESNTPSQSLPNRKHPKIMAWAYRRFYPRADLLFCQHRQTEQEMVDDYGVAAARIVTLPNPVPQSRLREAAAKPLRHPGSGLRFVTAGRLHRQKGFDRLIELFAQLPEDSHLTIYGEGDDREALEQRIRRLDLGQRVVLAGFTDRLPAALAGADACLIASRWEGLPNVALESLACGTAVIATPESGGIAELAAAAPGAVSVAAWGPEFRDRMVSCPQRNLTAPDESLLPQRYALERVAEDFNRHLSALAHSSGYPERSGA